MHLHIFLSPQGNGTGSSKNKIQKYNLKIKKKKNFHPNQERVIQEANKTAASILSQQQNQQQRSKWCLSILVLTMSMSPSAQKDHSSNLCATHPISSSLLAGFNRKTSHLSALLPHRHMLLRSIEANTVLIYL